VSQQIVADSNIFIAAVLQETYTKQADDLIRYWAQQHIHCRSNIVSLYEVAAVIRKHVYRRTLTTERAAQVRTALETLVSGITFMIDTDLLERGYELATRFNLPTSYDAQYLAVAERLGVEFWTADERLFNVVGKELNWIRWLGHFAPVNLE